MAKAYVFYNPLAGNGKCKDEVDGVKAFINDEIVFCDMTAGYAETLSNLENDDYIIICGGDGTLNRFVNENDVELISNDILYFATGSGNDFAHDIGLGRGEKPVSVKKYLAGLPEVEVNGNTYKFINAIGYGIDGYCCEEGDRLRAVPGKKVDYTAIAIKGLLFHYKPKDAKVTVDGQEHSFKKVWLAPATHGRYYGGGMMPTPAQSREGDDGKLSLMVWHSSGKLPTLMAFPSIFKGEHVNKTKMVRIFEGYEITVEFDKPTALQIDGETILGVSSYTARSRVSAKI